MVNRRLHFREERDSLEQATLRMGTVVEEALKKALAALRLEDPALARQVIDGDPLIDRMQIEVEDRCIKLIATEQPVATDLREIVTTIKIVSTLERIGDHASHLAKSILKLDADTPTWITDQIGRMTEIGTAMLHDALTSFIRHDCEEANAVARRDDELDQMNTELIEGLLALMQRDPRYIKPAATLLFLSRFLERIGDMVTNICELVVFAREGSHVELNP